MKIRAFHGLRFDGTADHAGTLAAIANGDVLPPKSTRFLPQVVSGLVWSAHGDPVE